MFQEMMSEEEAKMLPTKYEDMPILKLMGKLTEKAKDSKLDEKFFDSVKGMSSCLGKRLDLTPTQAVMYSLFIENYDDSSIALSDIQRYTHSTMIRIAELQDEIDAIERKRYIRRSESQSFGNSKHGYLVPPESIKALRENKPYVQEKKCNLPFGAFCRELDQIFTSRYEFDAPFDIFIEDALALVKNNLHLKIAQQLDAATKTFPETCDWAILAGLCVCELYHGKKFGLNNMGKVLECYQVDYMCNAIENEESELQKAGIAEFGFADGQVDKNCIQMTRKGIKQFLSEKKQKFDGNMSHIEQCSKISVKDMFYDDDVKAQIDRLSDLLSKKTFKEICQRLQKNGMRKGFACLFYGAPGTGKTESVLQLAKKTGRNIMQVNLAEIRDKYVGESEKNIRAVFDNYRAVAKDEPCCPILLFNEADAIIGKRLEKVEHSVDQMNNSIQNIILQELETFEGILIATTNLASNMDSAFERRFLYKVRFDKPTASVRKQIWQSLIKDIDEEVAGALASEFDFSGGQIENIARKQIVDNILYGESSDIYSSLKGYCQDESIQSKKNRPTMGFQLN